MKAIMPRGGGMSPSERTAMSGQNRSFQWETMEKMEKAMMAGMAMGHGHHDLPDDGELAEAVEVGGVHDIVRDGLEELKGETTKGKTSAA